MGTRSLIGRHNETTNQTDYIYCHWDGYVSHNGYILANYYNTPELVEALINQGCISSLGPKLGIVKSYVTKNGKDEYISDEERADRSLDGDGKVYHLDPKNKNGKATGLMEQNDYGQEYIYYFDPKTNKWQVKAYMWESEPNWTQYADLDKLIQTQFDKDGNELDLSRRYCLLYEFNKQANIFPNETRAYDANEVIRAYVDANDGRSYSSPAKDEMYDYVNAFKERLYNDPSFLDAFIEWKSHQDINKLVDQYTKEAFGIKR